MSVKVLLFDIGGVIGTNGWDRQARQRAVDHFDLDWELGIAGLHYTSADQLRSDLADLGVTA